MHVKVGMNTIHAVKWAATVLFQLESEGSLEVAKVLYVPLLKTNWSSVSALEDKGFDVELKKDKYSYIQKELPRTQQSSLVSGRVSCVAFL